VHLDDEEEFEKKYFYGKRASKKVKHTTEELL